jgi:DNA-binding NarL/FixJ family response regulator/DNA-binding SARP family transcriptional activator
VILLAAMGKSGADTASSVRYRDLGTVLVERNGAELPVGGVKPATILALLLIRMNRRVSADELMDALWGEKVSPRSRTTLESHVWRLRKLLDPDRPSAGSSVLVSDSGGYRLTAQPESADSARFISLAESAAAALSEGIPDRALLLADEALGLWRGRPYEPVSDALWAVPAVNRLEEVRDQLREHRVVAWVESGDPERALSELETMLTEMPYRERLWALRMRALHDCGRTMEALEAYRRARTVLLDEVGLEPGEELREQQRRILAQDDGQRAPARLRDQPLRVVVGDDHALVREGIVRMLERAGIDVVGEAADADEVLAAVRAQRPDVVVTDIQMPPDGTDDGLRAAIEIRGTMPDVGVIVLSQFLDDRYAIELVAGRADRVGYLLKEKVASPDVLVEAVRRVAAGGSALDPDVVDRLVNRARIGSPLDRLTSREKEVLALMAAGHSNTGIAARLFVTVPAVERHVTGIFAKLGLRESDGQQHRRVAAVLTYLQH